MATSIKIRDEDKRLLDRLQGEIMARRGRRVSQQDLVAWLLSLGDAHVDEFADHEDRPMTEREIATMLRLAVHTGIRTREEEIDRLLYGEGP
ncbi:MAG TPA: hypothetical protein VJ547_10185 [Candidatus Thermoplasmatota archaeon]|nr:hypothetical protein [Candidatus Thermoplasmatota archaeon]